MKKNGRKKPQQKKLPLKHETIRRLDPKDEGHLKTVAAGTDTDTCCTQSVRGGCHPSTVLTC